ncbi:acylneuraminate cytidylyltransferase [Paenibacillus sp. MSJ-34]|uniref:acylneuraminate cytidylyltransferase n=1 Tax=Paenibacillus sp. MSJ-34 TaxID=2841529 RepID=UPI001C0FFDFB|nr:acylneuraminate cytidylyltransferase [Paenibacillus sp. MSJ-34]MBU5440995.1 acylneuraminate cytidylyltransferase [Paenibacillus sp. MSJ-34]
MYNTVALIPARGGSKSISMKNIKLINNRPLIYWALDAAVECQEIDHVFVSTDHDEIKNCVLKYNHPKVSAIGRSPIVSTDTASTESVMLEFSQNYNFNNIVLIQATSPLITAHDLSRGIARYYENDVDSVLSGVWQKRFIWNIEGTLAIPQNYNPACRPMRQEFKGYMIENGAFYITSKQRLMKTGTRISGKISMIEMAQETFLELDEPLDWLIIEQLLKNRQNDKIELKEKIKKIKALFVDCDGVLTDGGMYYSEKNDELKKFNTRDGMAFQILKEYGYITGIITGEVRDLVKRRAMKLRVDEIHLGVKNKAQLLQDIMNKYNFTHDEIAYIGDDINDLEVIKSVGLGCCVNDGMQVVKQSADYITSVNGGYGAVREVVELLIGVKGS